MHSVPELRKTAISRIVQRLLILCCGLLFSAAMASDCIKMHVIQSGQLGFLDDQNTPTGAHWDLLTELEARTGLCINKQLLPYARIWKSIEIGEHDGGIIFRSPDREHLAIQVAPLATLHTVVIPKSSLEIQGYEELAGLTIAKLRGNRLNDQFDSDPDLKKVNLDNYEDIAKMIGTGRVDAVAGGFVSLAFQLSRHGYLDTVNLNGAYSLGSRQQWLQISKKSNRFVDTNRLKAGIDSIMKDGTYDKIMERYYGPLWSEIKSVIHN